MSGVIQKFREAQNSSHRPRERNLQRQRISIFWSLKLPAVNRLQISPGRISDVEGAEGSTATNTQKNDFRIRQRRAAIEEGTEVPSLPARMYTVLCTYCVHIYSVLHGRILHTAWRGAIFPLPLQSCFLAGHGHHQLTLGSACSFSYLINFTFLQDETKARR
jgi:hypothetical protein